MTQLTKHVRDHMAKALVKHRFKQEAEQFLARSTALFNEAMDEWHSQEVLKLMAKLLKLDPDAFGRRGYCAVRARGLWVQIGGCPLGTSGVNFGSYDNEGRPTLPDRRDEQLSDELKGRIADYAISLKKFNDEVEGAYRKALGTLSRFNTAKKLQEQWPEAIPVIGHLIPAECRTLPVVQLASINDEFGLPPTELDEAA